MCGIAGFLKIAATGDQTEYGFAQLQAMSAAIAHRGPDAAETWHKDQLYLAHRRLSIIDVAGGQQPMHSHDQRFTLVYNGEIYNHRELRSELEGLGHRFHTHHSDSEVLIEAYRAWGADCLNRFNGMWAFAIWDDQERELFLARDRMGQKPLYWGFHRSTFAFASELNALRAHPVFNDCEMEPLALAKYFGYGFIPAPHALYRHISKLESAHWLRIKADGDMQKQRYWQCPQPIEQAMSFAEAQEELRHRLKQAVTRRLLADVPVGLFLSGGIDSSSVGFFAQEQGLRRAFYVGFDEPSFDETPYIHEAAKVLQLDAEGQQLAMHAMPDAIRATLARLDEPMGDPSLIPTSLLCQSAAKHVKVAIGGDGADELLAGYDPYLALRLATIYQRLVPGFVHKLLLKGAQALPVSHRNMSFEFKLKRTLSALADSPSYWPVRWMAPLTTAEINTLLGTQFSDAEIFSEMLELAEKADPATPFNYLTQYFLHTYLADNILTKVDRAGMLHGLEVRAPFLDVEVVTFLAQLPQHYKLKGGTTKHLLKAAMADHLPKHLVHRKKKGFGMPVGYYFQQKGQLQQLKPVGGLNFPFLQQMLQEHQLGKANHRMALWNWLVLQTTCES